MASVTVVGKPDLMTAGAGLTTQRDSLSAVEIMETWPKIHSRLASVQLGRRGGSLNKDDSESNSDESSEAHGSSGLGEAETEIRCMSWMQ